MASSWIFLCRAEKDAVAAEAAEAAKAGIILLLRNPPHWWKVHLASSRIFLCRAEKDAVFWWRASRRGVLFYWREMEAWVPFTAVSRLPPSPLPLSPDSRAAPPLDVPHHTV